MKENLQHEWSSVFEYVSGVLKWRIRPSRCVLPGTVAGNIDSDGYIKICFRGKNIKSHRVIWQMHNGPIPDGMEIDHINHDRMDNRIENLRLVSHQDNAKNRGKTSRNTSGVVGVTWVKKYMKWQVQIMHDRKNIFIGYFNDFDLAVKARKEAESKYRFHENHGK